MSASRLRGWVGKLALLAVSGLLALALGEAAARTVVDVRPFRYLPDDASPSQWNVDHPTRGYALTPGWRGRLQATEYDVAVAIGADGLRRPPTNANAARELESSEPRIFAVGDSFVFGVGLEPDETMPHRLERHLRALEPGTAAEVWNLGVPGYALQPSILHVEERMHHRPDAVVLFVYAGTQASGANDVTGAVDFERTTSEQAAARATTTDEPPTASRRSTPRWRDAKRWVERRSALYNGLLIAFGPHLRALRDGSSSSQGAEDGRFERGWVLVDEWFGVLDALVAPDDVPVVVVYVPELPDLLRDETTPGPRLAALAARRGFAFVDGAAVLGGSEAASFYFPLDGHLRPAGADRLAAAVAPVVAGVLQGAAPPA